MQDYCDGGVHRERGPKVRNYDYHHGLDLDLDDNDGDGDDKWDDDMRKRSYGDKMENVDLSRTSSPEGDGRERFSTLAFSPHLQYVWQLWQI